MGEIVWDDWTNQVCCMAIKNDFTQWSREDWWQSIKNREWKKGSKLNATIVLKRKSVLLIEQYE